jgi:hypothetical protein
MSSLTPTSLWHTISHVIFPFDMYFHHDIIIHAVLYPEDPCQSRADAGNKLFYLHNYELNNFSFFIK